MKVFTTFLVYVPNIILIRAEDSLYELQSKKQNIMLRKHYNKKIKFLNSRSVMTEFLSKDINKLCSSLKKIPVDKNNF